MKRAAIYARISDDAEGHGLGAPARSEIVKTWASQPWMGGLTEPYVDNDVSATRSKARPAYERLLTDHRAERVDVVIVWALDRLHRRPIELEHFIALVERHGVELANVAGASTFRRTAVASTRESWAPAAANEAANTRRRIVRKQRELRESGKPFGGGIRCYGWANDRMTADSLLSRKRSATWWLGCSQEVASSLARDLNQRGVKTVSQWMSETRRVDGRTPTRVRSSASRGA